MSPYDQGQMVWHKNKTQWLYELRKCLQSDKELSDDWLKRIRSLVNEDSTIRVSALKYYGLNRPEFIHKDKRFIAFMKLNITGLPNGFELSSKLNTNSDDQRTSDTYPDSLRSSRLSLISLGSETGSDAGNDVQVYFGGSYQDDEKVLLNHENLQLDRSCRYSISLEKRKFVSQQNKKCTKFYKINK